MAANYFVAFPVPVDAWLERAVADVPAGVRCLHPDDVHLTVAFLGSVGEERARQAWQVALDRDVPGCKIRLAGLRGMGNPRRPTALSVELSDGHDEVCRAIAALRGPMIEAAGAEPDDRPPLPHITIARPPRKADAALRRRALDWAEGVPPIAVELTLDRIALYTGNDDAARQYRALEVKALKAVG